VTAVRLKNKVAIVTGGNGGMGRAITTAFLREGCAVASFDWRDNPRAAALRETSAARAGQVVFLPVDVSDRAVVQEAMGQVRARFGQLDILVNTAAILQPVPFLELTDEEWDRTMAVNLKGYFICAQLAARVMVEQGHGGKIVNISSNSQVRATPNTTHYSAAKGGVGMLTRNMALELAPYHIAVNAVCPGPTLTDLNDKRFRDAAYLEARTATVPWGRLGQPEDMAAAVLFLASAESDFVTGAALFVDGGQSLVVGG
jgi:NAD(P)-dependent dehydrogenase (short-subunit alcohol dehydrogenase family)